MKALKNESTIYMEMITSAITDCYSQNSQPTNSQLMKLYATIGKHICEQGEKAFVVFLAEQLSEKFSMIKGFSPRNLRRMRESYRTYESNPRLMQKAQALSWTQNTVILEYCDITELREYYIDLATEKQLSKLALIEAIETEEHLVVAEEKSTEDVVEGVAPVCDDTNEQPVYTSKSNKTECRAFVTACEHLHQGISMEKCMTINVWDDYSRLIKYYINRDRKSVV